MNTSLINDNVINYPSLSNLNYFWNSGSVAGLCLIIQIAAPILLIHVGGSPLMGVVFSALWNYRKFHLGSGGKNRAAFSLVFNLVRKIIYANIETLIGPAYLCALPIIDLEYYQNWRPPLPILNLNVEHRIQFPRAPRRENPFERVADQAGQGWLEYLRQDADAP